MVMLTRLVTLERAGVQVEAAAAQHRRNPPVEVARLEPVQAAAPSPSLSPAQAVTSENSQQDDDIAGLLNRFGEGGLDAYLGITQ